MKDYYTIGEISKIYGIGKDSLMYYEKLGIIEPYRNEKGYRLYSMNDLWRLNLIKELRSFGLPMIQIKAYLEDRNIYSTQKLLEEEIDHINEEMKALERTREDLFNRLSRLKWANEHRLEGQIQKVYIKKRRGFVLQAHIERDEEVDFLMQKINKVYKKSIQILGGTHIGAIFNQTSFNQGIYNIFDSVFCLLESNDEEGALVLEEGYYITCQYRGDYKQNQITIKKMLEYIKDHNLEIIGPPIEIYQIDIHETAKEEEFLTEIQIPIQVNPYSTESV